MVRAGVGDRMIKGLGYMALSLAIALLIVTQVWQSPAVAGTARHYTELEFPPLPDITLPDYTRFQLDNGIIVYLAEDHELPLVSGSATFRTGDRFEPADKVGLANLVGEVMRSGGTLRHPADELNQLLEDQAASVETSIDVTSGSASFSALSEDLETVFALFAEVLREPALPQDRIDLTKNQWGGAIARRNDDPEEIASREFQKLIYGSDSPYARTTEYATLRQISRQDVVEFYRRHIHPQTMLLAVVGDFDSAQMRSLIETHFGSWRSPADAVVPDVADLPPVVQVSQGVHVVDQPQLTQSYVQLGHLGGQFSNPDYAALSVLNEIMNGFGGRLTNEVRSRQGLAYVVYAYWSPRYDYPGLFVGGGQTRTETTVTFIRSLLAEVEKIRTTTFSDEELIRAKDSVLNSFVFSFQTAGQTLSRLIRYEYFGYPSDFIFQYQQAVKATTSEDVLRAAQTYLKPESITTLVVGNVAAMDPPLSTLAIGGTVTPVDVSIPPP